MEESRVPYKPIWGVHAILERAKRPPQGSSGLTGMLYPCSCRYLLDCTRIVISP